MSAKYKSKGKNYRAINVEKTKSNPDLFFPTYHNLTRVLFDEISFASPFTTFLEPAAGMGDISNLIKKYYPEARVYECDLYPKAKEIKKVNFLNKKQRNDFLAGKQLIDVIITNPPFKLWMKFFKAAAEIDPNHILFLSPLDYLHSVERFKTIYKNGYLRFRLKTCYVFERRPLFDAKYRPDCLMPTGATSFCWLHFTRNNEEPKIKWLEINKYMGVPTEVEQILFKDMEEKK